MDTMAMLQQIFQVCIIPLLGVLTTYLVMFIRNKTDQLKKETDNELYQKYMEMLSETITNCVIATNQTYVEALKNKNAFDAAAQKEAFNMTYQAVMSIISQDAMDFLNEAVGDLDAYIRKTIEERELLIEFPIFYWSIIFNNSNSFFIYDEQENSIGKEWLKIGSL